MRCAHIRIASRARAIGAALAATVVLNACGSSSTEPGGDGEIRDGILYRVSELLVAESFPVQVGVSVELRNVSSSPRTVVFPDGCVVLMRAYAEGGSLAWDMGAGRACTEALVEVRLAPREAREFKTGLVSAAEILDGGLPAGEYLITAYLRPADTVEIEAGRVDLAIP